MFVTGMHRSATSLTMRMLARLGLDLGDPHSFVPADADDNPDGYQEHLSVVELDDELLRMLGGHASEPPVPPAGWELSASCEPLVVRAETFVGETFSREPWALKDPRISLLLPFWRRVCPELRVVVCLRNPLEVAISMERRGAGYGIEHWLHVWVQHTAAALAGSDRSRRAIVLCEDLLTTPQDVARELSVFVHGLPAEPEVCEHAAAVVDPSRRRSMASARDLESDPRVPRPVARYYSAVRELARAQQQSRMANLVR